MLARQSRNSRYVQFFFIPQTFFNRFYYSATYRNPVTATVFSFSLQVQTVPLLSFRFFSTTSARYSLALHSVSITSSYHRKNHIIQLKTKIFIWIFFFFFYFFFETLAWTLFSQTQIVKDCTRSVDQNLLSPCNFLVCLIGNEDDIFFLKMCRFYFFEIHEYQWVMEHQLPSPSSGSPYSWIS